MYKLDLKKAEEPEAKLPTSVGSERKQGNSRKTSTSASLTVYAKEFLWKIFKEMGIPDHLTCLLRNPLQVKKQQLEPDMEQWTDSQLGKGYDKAVYCHPAYLTYMQSTSCEMLDWKKHKLESRLPGEISITSDMQMITTLMAGTKGELKSLLMKVKGESEKAGLKLKK